jgi:hypothetical protein
MIRSEIESTTARIDSLSIVYSSFFPFNPVNPGIQ